MRSTIAEYGFFLVALILVASFFANVSLMFEDGGIIKNEILDYIANMC